jgi:hypothetical protein
VRQIKAKSSGEPEHSKRCRAARTIDVANVGRSVEMLPVAPESDAAYCTRCAHRYLAYAGFRISDFSIEN